MGVKYVCLFQTSNDGNTTTSTLSFVPRKEDDGKYLSCKAENKMMSTESLEDRWKLEIHCELISFSLICISCYSKLNWIFSVIFRQKSLGRPEYLIESIGTTETYATIPEIGAFVYLRSYVYLRYWIDSWLKRPHHCAIEHFLTRSALARNFAHFNWSEDGATCYYY